MSSTYHTIASIWTVRSLKSSDISQVTLFSMNLDVSYPPKVRLPNTSLSPPVPRT
jgi:hypothetical protein